MPEGKLDIVGLVWPIFRRCFIHGCLSRGAWKESWRISCDL